jgi:hypothetical protein
MAPTTNIDCAGADCDVDAKLRYSNVETTAVCDRERDVAIPDDRLEVDAHVSCDPLDAALDRLRTHLVFEKQPRTQLKEAQRRLVAGRVFLGRFEGDSLGDHRSQFRRPTRHRSVGTAAF